MDVHESSSFSGTSRARSGALESGESSASAEQTPVPHTEVGRRVQLGFVATDREILLRGRRAFDRREDALALESLTRLIAHGVRFADVHYMIGILHERGGETEAALASLREAIRINPSYAEALLALASLHERSGDYERSERYADRASQLSRSSAGGLDPTTRGKLANQQAGLAEAFVEAGELRDAILQYRGALDRCPTFHDIRHRLGITLREAGLPAQAAQEFARILRLRPGMLESQIQLGLTFYTMGRTPLAIQEWNAVLEKDPSRDEARMYLRLVGGIGRERDLAAPIPAQQIVAIEDPAEDLSIVAITSPAASGREGEAISGWSKTQLSRADSEESDT